MSTTAKRSERPGRSPEEEPVASNPFRTTPPWQRENAGWKGALAGLTVLILALGSIAGVVYLAWYAVGDDESSDAATPIATTGSCGAVTADDTEPLASEPDLSPPPDRSIAVVNTNFGPLEVLLFGDLAPCGVAGFSELAEAGFYNNHACHGMTVQPEQPTSTVNCGEPGRASAHLEELDDWSDDGEATFGPGWRFRSEVDGSGNLVGDVLALPLDDTGKAGSEFTIVRGSAVPSSQLSVVGQVVDGFRTLDDIAATSPSELYEGYPPQQVIVTGVHLQDVEANGDAAPGGDESSASTDTPEPTDDDASEPVPGADASNTTDTGRREDG
ncbi:peptidylprolyl isomerase [Haloglycomyces albus]|uniref:peptidylprolyl isomerase n=1 Tax=Haloglycomyces albus TaxID=526067 RepID=UPI00046D69D6|nr:peptidylprolyl isomerase [Haloglycomyces albus]